MSFTETAKIAAARTELRELQAKHVPFAPMAPVSPLLRAGQELAARIRDPRRNSFGAVEQGITAGVELPRTFGFRNLRADEMDVVLEGVAFFVRAESGLPLTAAQALPAPSSSAVTPRAIIQAVEAALKLPFDARVDQGLYTEPASVIAAEAASVGVRTLGTAAFREVLRGVFAAVAGTFERRAGGTVRDRIEVQHPIAHLAEIAAPFVEEAERRGIVGGDLRNAIGNYNQLTSLLRQPDVFQVSGLGFAFVSIEERSRLLADPFALHRNQST